MSQQHINNLAEQFSKMQVSSEQSPEQQKFNQLPRETQQKLLRKFPTVLATSILRFGNGDDCDTIMQHQVKSAPEFLSATDTYRNNAVGRALLSRSISRAEFLIDVAASQNPAALRQRNMNRESLAMLSSSLGENAKPLLNVLLRSDITQVHRHYDCNGQNLLHHCVSNDSIEPLTVTLSLLQGQLENNNNLACNICEAFHMNDDNGNTPLHIAAASNRSDMLHLINNFSINHRMDLNFDVTQHRGNRRTPLMEAAANEATDACQFLIENDLVDIYMVDADDMQAVDLTQNQQLKLLLRDGQQQEQQMQQQELASTAKAASSIDNRYATIDSGVATCTTHDELSGIAQNVLADSEIKHICCCLERNGKSDLFLEKLSVIYKGDFDTMNEILGISYDPVPMFLGQIRKSPEARNRIRDVLMQVGELQLANEI